MSHFATFGNDSEKDKEQQNLFLQKKHAIFNFNPFYWAGKKYVSFTKYTKQNIDWLKSVNSFELKKNSIKKG